MRSFKQPENKLRKFYRIFLELGIIFSLAVALVAFNISWETDQTTKDLTEEQEIVNIKDVVRTKHQSVPPAPPLPQVPREVPNDEIVQTDPLNINSELDINRKLSIPPPPKRGGQKKGTDKKNQVFVIVQQPPKLIGGLDSLQSMIDYPEFARKAGIEGRVYVQFIINKEGEVVNPHVIRGIGGGCNKEALRVIKKAEFKPGRQRGKPVRVKYSMPIVFRLNQPNA